jgi:hypothetical protein
MGVATAISIAGVAAAAVSTGTSISQANKANEARIKAQKQVEAATNEAKKEIERMPMQELSLNLDVYEQSREAQQRGIQQVMSQAELDPRQAAAVGGRAMMAGIEGERGIRTDQAKQMFELDKIKAQERQDASNALKDLNVAEAEGAQAAASDASARQTAATQQAIQSGAQGITGAMNLYSAVQGPYDATMAGITAASISKKYGGDYSQLQETLLKNSSNFPDVDFTGLQGATSMAGVTAWLDQQPTNVQLKFKPYLGL